MNTTTITIEKNYKGKIYSISNKIPELYLATSAIPIEIILYTAWKSLNDEINADINKREEMEKI